MAQKMAAQMQQMKASGQPVPQEMLDKYNALTKGGQPVSTLPEAGSGQLEQMPDLGGKPTVQPPADQQSTVPPQVQEQWNQIDSQITQVDQRLQELTQQMMRTPIGQARNALQVQIAQLQNQKTQLQNDRQGALDKWNSIGQYEDQLQGILAQQFPGTQVNINDIPEAQRNEFFRQATEALQAGKSPSEIANIYRSMFPEGYNFDLATGTAPLKETIDAYLPASSPTINQSGAAIGRTDTAGINTTGQTAIGAQVTQQELDALKEELSAKGYTEAEKEAILRGDLQALEADKQQAIRSAVGQASAGGFGQTLGAIINATAGTAQRYDAEAERMRGELTRQGLEQAATRRAAGIAGLGQVAAREAGIAGTQAQAGLGAAEIGSRENIASGQLQLAKDSLFQEGQLTAAGQQINQQLQSYGFQLDKVLADQNFNLETFKTQLQERIANQTGNIEAAKLQADNITKSIQFAMDETQIDNQRKAQVAELELRAAQGDQQAKLDVQQLKVEQELRELGLSNDHTDRLGGWLMEIMMKREALSQQDRQFLQALQQQAKESGKTGFLDIVNSILQGGAAAAVAALT
jgi:hypothetical protein